MVAVEEAVLALAVGPAVPRGVLQERDQRRDADDVDAGGPARRLHGDACEHHVAAVRAAPQRRARRVETQRRQPVVDGAEVGDRVEALLEVVEGDPALAVPRRPAHVRHEHVEARQGEGLEDRREEPRRLGLRAAVHVHHGRAGDGRVRRRTGVPEAGHLLPVRRRHAVHRRRHQPVAQLGRQHGAAVDELRHRAGARVDTQDRARVGRRHRGEHETRAVRGPPDRERYDGWQVDVDPVRAVGLVHRERVEPVDVVADHHRRAVARELHVHVVVVGLDEHPPGSVQREVVDGDEVAVVVGGHDQPGVAQGPAGDGVVGVLVGVGERTTAEPAPRARSPCRAAGG